MVPHPKCPRCGVAQLEPLIGGICARCAAVPIAAGLESESQRATSLLTSISRGAARGDDAGRPALHFPDYEEFEEIARGGMGIVFKARQISLNRTVAVKVIRSGHIAGSAEVQRFLIEARAAATLQHPNIVAIHEIGENDGQHFFSMDYIEGETLGELVRKEPLGARDAALLAKKIAETIHFAHQRGILHRDLKPSNILIDRFGQPRVTDFGLARMMSEGSDLTVSGMVMGSPSYMPPEQAQGRVSEITVRSDIYAIGAMLYHLLTGKPPFLAESPLATMKLVVENEPVPPRQLNLRIPRDLETICLKCLEKSPARRYPSALEIADELERFLTHQPIRSRAIGPVERFGRWCRRKPAFASALGILFCGGVAVLWQWRRAERLAENQTVLRQDANKSSFEALLGRAGVLAGSGLAGQRDGSLAALESAARLNPAPEVRDRMVASLALMDLRARPSAAPGVTASSRMAFSPDLKWFAHAEGGSIITLRETGGEHSITFESDAGPESLQFSPNGKLLAAVAGQKVRVWEIESRRAVCVLSNFTGQIVTDFSPDSRQIVVADASGAIRLFQTASGLEQETKFNLRRACSAIRFSPDGSRLAVASPESLNAFILEIATGVESTLAHAAPVQVLEWHPRGELLACACADHQICVWDWARSRSIVLRGHSAAVTHLAFAHRGFYLASAGEDNSVRVWDAGTGRALVRTEGMAVAALRFGANEKVLAGALAGQPGELQLLDVVWPDEAVAFQKFSAEARGSAVSLSVADGLLAGGDSDGVQLWDFAHASLLGTLQTGAIQDVVIAPGATALFTRGFYGLHRVPLHRIIPGENPLLLAGPPLYFDSAPGEGPVLLCPNGELLAADKERLLVYDSATGKLHREIPAEPGIQVLAASRDSTRIAGANWETKQVAVWNARGELERRFPANGRAQLAFSPGGESLATVTEAECRIWQTRDWSATRLFKREHPGARPGAVAFSAKGTLLAWTTADESAAIVDLTSGATLFSIPAGAPVNALEFAPGGDGLIVSADGSAPLLWDIPAVARTLRARGISLPPTPALSQLVRDSSGRSLRLLADMHKIEFTQQARKDIGDLEETLRANPADTGARKTLATIAADFDQTQLAREQFAELLRANPRDIPILFQDAYLLMRQGDLRGAIADYKQVLGSDPRNAFAARQLASIYLQGPLTLRDFAAGTRLAELALEVEPQDDMSKFWAGVARYRAGRFAEALNQIEAAIGGTLDAPTFLLYRAMTLAKLGRADEARLAYERALKVLESRTAAVQAREYYLRFADEARALFSDVAKN